MDLQKVSLKILSDAPVTLDLDPFLQIFARWRVQDWVDLADYAHMTRGPGIVLIGHRANFSFDMGTSAPGVLYLSKKDLQDPVLVAPDAGGVERTRTIAKRLKAGLAIIDKRRDGPNVAVFMHLIGDVKDRDVVIIDDMIDTAGTLMQAVEALKREGARRILACAVHGVLSGPAIKRLAAPELEEVVITNSIPQSPDKALAKIQVLSVAPLVAEAIRRIHDEESVSGLFV